MREESSLRRKELQCRISRDREDKRSVLSFGLFVFFSWFVLALETGGS